MKYIIIDKRNKKDNIAMDYLGNNVFEKDYSQEEYNNERNVAARVVYPFSNENLDEIFADKDLTGKKVATVGSSGDQVLYAIQHGAKDITVMDANPMAQPYIELKLAAIKNLSYEEFLEYFTYHNILNSKYYRKISHDLSDYTKGFWDNIIMEVGAEDNQDNVFQNLFQSIGVGRDFAVNRGALSYFKDKEKYKALKTKLDGCKIEFIVSQFEDFESALKDKYHLILLSNIYDYINEKDYFNGVKQIKRKHLAKDGIIQIYYQFKGNSLEGFLENFKKYFNLKKLHLQKVKDIRNYEMFKEIIDEGNGNDSFVIYL